MLAVTVQQALNDLRRNQLTPLKLHKVESACCCYGRRGFYTSSLQLPPLMATIMASPATQTSVQRGPCTTIRTPSGRYTMKRRASRACQCCRSKKIKCDVVDRGIPCTRCRLEKFECSVVEAKNKTLRRSRKLSSHSTDPSHNLPNETQSVPPAAGLSGQDTAVALDGFLSTLPLGLLDLELNHRMSGVSASFKLHTCRLTMARSDSRSGHRFRVHGGPDVTEYRSITSELTFTYGVVKPSPF